MNVKHFVFGLGLGLVLTSLIFFAVARTTDDGTEPQENTISDQEIIERAFALGMIQIEGTANKIDTSNKLDNDNVETNNTSDANENEDGSTGNSDSSDGEQDEEADSEIDNADNAENADNDDNQSTGTENQNRIAYITDEQLIEMAAEIGMVFPDESDKTSNEETETVDEVVNFRVIPGMTARAIAKLLQNNGIIDDAAIFEDYLVSKGVQSILRSGYYSIPKGMPYSEIVVILSTTPKYR